MQKKTTLMHPNQLRAILIFLITPTTTWQFAGYPYNTETQKPQKSHTKICLSTGYTLSTGYQWTPLILLKWSTSWSLYAYIGIFSNFHRALKVVSVILSWGLFQTTTFKRRQFAGLHIKLLFNGRPIFWCNILVPCKIYGTVLF